MDTDLDTLVTALYVTVDDLLLAHPGKLPARPGVGIAPKISDSELITMSVMGALLGFVNERRWIRWAKTHLTSYFPYIPGQSGYNKRLRKLTGTMDWVRSVLARDTTQWCDGTWLVDSTPVECGRSRQTSLRSDLAGFAEYGYCASHTRFFWGLRLHLVATPAGLPIMFALTGAKADDRTTLLDMLDAQPTRPGQLIIADKNYFGRHFEADLAAQGLILLRKTRTGEKPRPGAHLFKPLRQVIESINATLKTHLNIEHHGARTPTGVITRILTQLLALTTAIWHNDHTQAPTKRSLTPYDH